MFLMGVKGPVRTPFAGLVYYLQTNVWGDIKVEASESGQILRSQHHRGSKKIKVKQSCYRAGHALRAPEVEDSWISRQSAREGGILRLKCDGTRAKNRFCLPAKRTSPFNSAEGRQFSRLLAAVVMLDTPSSEVV